MFFVSEGTIVPIWVNVVLCYLGRGRRQPSLILGL